MRIAVVGSRDYPNWKAVHAYIETIHPYDTVVSGGARGVDLIAEQHARYCGLAVEVLRADWDKHGRSAGIIRNTKVVDISDRIVAFWDGKSRGTLNTIETARRARKPVEVYDSEGQSVGLVGAAPADCNDGLAKVLGGSHPEPDGVRLGTGCQAASVSGLSGCQGSVAERSAQPAASQDEDAVAGECQRAPHGNLVAGQLSLVPA